MRPSARFIFCAVNAFIIIIIILGCLRRQTNVSKAQEQNGAKPKTGQTGETPGKKTFGRRGRAQGVHGHGQRNRRGVYFRDHGPKTLQLKPGCCREREVWTCAITTYCSVADHLYADVFFAVQTYRRHNDSRRNAHSMMVFQNTKITL